VLGRRKPIIDFVLHFQREQTMAQKFLSVIILFILVLGSLTCQRANQTSNQQDSQGKTQGTTPETSSKQETPKWPPLPSAVFSPYVIDTTQLARVEAGDTLALPLAGGFRTLTLTAPLKDDVLGIKDLNLQIKDLQGNNVGVIVKSLHSHDPKEGQASFVWHNLTVRPDGGVAMDMVGAFEAGKLVGYKYDLSALEALVAGNKIAILDQEGWRVVKIRVPLKEGFLGIEGFKVSSRSEPIANLRAFDSREGKAGLIWDSQGK
jgi:hypothetical protein